VEHWGIRAGGGGAHPILRGDRVEGGELSGSARHRSATLRLVRRGLTHDAKVRQVYAGPLLLDRLPKGRAGPAQSRVCAQVQHGRRDGA
jgi:hypothetical protein